MKTKLTIAFVAAISLGLYLNFDYQQSTIQPLNLANNHLDRIVASSDPDTILADLHAIKANLDKAMVNLPEDKNPVWIYPTQTTNFQKISNDIDIMVVSLEKISFFPKDSSSYHIGLLELNERADYIQEGITDAKTFLYFSATNVFYTLIWLLGVTGLTRMLIGS